MNVLVDNIGNASGSLVTPTQYVVRGSAKAWANLNGTGTIALRDSFNVSSVVDNGTGNYTFGFTNNMVDTNYKASGQSRSTTTSTIHLALMDLSSASSHRVISRQADVNTAEDCHFVMPVIQGDLA